MLFPQRSPPKTSWAPCSTLLYATIHWESHLFSASWWFLWLTWWCEHDVDTSNRNFCIGLTRQKICLRCLIHPPSWTRVPKLHQERPGRHPGAMCGKSQRSTGQAVGLVHAEQPGRETLQKRDPPGTPYSTKAGALWPPVQTRFQLVLPGIDGRCQRMPAGSFFSARCWRIGWMTLTCGAKASLQSYAKASSSAFHPKNLLRLLPFCEPHSQSKTSWSWTRLSSHLCTHSSSSRPSCSGWCSYAPCSCNKASSMASWHLAPACASQMVANLVQALTGNCRLRMHDVFVHVLRLHGKLWGTSVLGPPHQHPPTWTHHVVGMLDETLTKPLSLSLRGSGFTKPQSTCQQLLRTRNCAQLVSFKTGMFRDSSFVSRTDFSTGSDKAYFLVISLWQSLSEFWSVHLASSVNPPELDADARPISATTFRAASTADRHEASAHGEKKDIYNI